MSNMDPNTWYRMYTNDNGKDAWGGTILLTNHTYGAVFSQSFNASNVKPEQKWQFYAVDSEYYVLRTQASGFDSFMSTKYDVNQTADTHTELRMTRNNASDDSVYWRTEPWGNGWWMFWNKDNGTKYHFGRGGSTGTVAFMDSNITSPQPQQQFRFESISAINDKRFSTVSLPATSVTSAATLSTSSTSSQDTGSASPPSSSSTSSSGLSVGAKAGIGVAVGVIAILAIVLALFFYRKRKPKNVYAEAPTDDRSDHIQKEQWAYEIGSEQTHEMPYGHAKHEAGGKQRAAEIGGVGRVEAPSDTLPAELPGSTIHRGQ